MISPNLSETLVNSSGISSSARGGTSYRAPALLLPQHPLYGETYDAATQAELAALTRIPVGIALDKESWREHPGLCAQTEVLFGSWGFPLINAEFLAAFPRLKAVFYAAGSIKAFVTDEFWDRDIVISSAADANAVPVAEFTLAQIILASKHAWTNSRRYHHHRRRGARGSPPGMYGTTIGLISLGKIGRLVAQLLRPFSVNVIAYDPFCNVEQARTLGVSLVGLEELFARSTVVSCHCPLLPETTGMLRAGHFSAMPAGASFINTARGAIVHEPDLVRVLCERPDLTALLDVTYPEPPPPESPLFSLENVFLTTHIAGSIGNECHRMGRYMLEEYQRFISGQPLHYQITRETLARLA